jgi:hypothetical protein
LSTNQFGSGELHIPVADLSRRTHKYREVIDEAIRRVLDRSNFVLGGEVESFEKSFAEYIGTQFCVGVANGTDAIELSLKALGVTSGVRVADSGAFHFGPSPYCSETHKVRRRYMLLPAWLLSLHTCCKRHIGLDTFVLFQPQEGGPHGPQRA